VEKKVKEPNKKTKLIFEYLLESLIVLVIGSFIFIMFLSPVSSITDCIFSKCFSKTRVYAAFVISSIVMVDVAFLIGKDRGRREADKYYRGE